MKEYERFIQTFYKYDKAFAIDLYLIYNRWPSARIGYILRSIYTIRFVAYDFYSGVWERALMSDFYSFADGEI